jgi:crotonobetainyl-CoA:carnitine CoA-transferase CaiB-like acyl-CoA transferase
MLDGVRVLDLAGAHAPLAGQVLAELGADVVRFAAAPPRAALERLIADADVLIESCDPRTVTTLGLDTETIAARAPALVHVSITPFGRGGPKSHYRATDLVVAAASGYQFLTGAPGAAPLRISAPQAHAHAGTDAGVATLIALRHRDATGVGQHVDVSMQDSMTLALLGRALDGPLGQPRAERSSGQATIGAVRVRYLYRVRDGYALVQHGILPPLAAFQRRLVAWAIEAGVLDAAFAESDWGTLAFRLVAGNVSAADWETVDRAIAALLAPLDKDTVMREAVARKLLVAPVLHVGDLLDSAHFASRGFAIDGADGRRPGPFARFSRSSLPMGEPRPPVGADDPGWRAPRRRAVREASRSMPLSGLKVVDLFWVVAGPGATRMLADAGATVVHVESRSRLDMARSVPPYIDGIVEPERAALFHTTNANKLDLALDLASEAGRDVLRDLIVWADVFTESFSPGVVERLGFGYEAVRAINPRIVMISSCLLGQTGPWRDYAGFGNLAAAVTGFHALTGRPGEPPTGCYGPYTDFIGVRYNAAAILAALEHRDRSGEGQYVDMAQAEAAVHFLAPEAMAWLNGRTQTSARGNRDAAMAPHGVYRCAGEDRWVAIAVEDDAAWRALCGAMGQHALADDPALATLAGRRANEDALDARIDTWTRTLEADEVETRLQAAGVAAHAVLDTHQLWREPALVARGHFRRIAHPLHGETWIESGRVLYSRTPALEPAAAPVYGGDHDRVLGELLGYERAKIEDLAAKGVLT